MRSIKLTGPWSVPTSKKKNFSPNLNQYRNAHHFTLSKAKREYAQIIKDQLEGVEPFDKVTVILTAYPPTKRRLDNDNMAPHVKFAMDALVDEGILVDDDYRYVLFTGLKVGGVDSMNPRVEFLITEAEEEDELPTKE